MAYENTQPFVKEKNGIKAPAGFHYMPNGRLMSDAHHVASSGYIELKITSFDFNTNDILNGGETKSFTINGDEGAVFSLEIYDSNGRYYNFNTNTWSTEKAILSKQSVKGSYNVDVIFDALTADSSSSLKTFTINLFAETVHNIKTTHDTYVEVRNPDDTININKSTGSNSNILTKKIYQDVLKTLKLSCVAPSRYGGNTSVVDGATSSSDRIVIDDNVGGKIVHVGDKVTTTGIAASTHTLVDAIDPDGDNTKEIKLSRSDSATNDASITFTPGFNGMTPHYTDSDTGAATASLSSAETTIVSFNLDLNPLTGRAFNVLRVPTIDDLCAITTVTIGSAALPIDGEDTSSSSLFYRWPVTNAVNLTAGMVLDPARRFGGTSTTTPAVIGDYLTTKTEKVVTEGVYGSYIEYNTVDDVSVDAVDFDTNPVTAIDRNGKITAQAGNIVFNRQQADALKSDANVRIIAYGERGIEDLTGMKVKLKSVSLDYNGDGTRAATLTTVGAATSSSTSVSLAEVGDIVPGMSISGVGINPSAAEPTVVLKSTTSGSGQITMSSSQTLEAGQTLFFNGLATVLKIKCTLEISNMPISDTTLYFDVEKFLDAV